MPTKNIASGAITFYSQFGSYLVAAESGTADNLDNVTLKRGGVILIQPDSGDMITLRDTAGGTGNLRTPSSADLALTDTQAAVLVGDGALVWVFSQATGGGGGGSGTVTSVGMTVPSFLSVTGTPITTFGILALALATQAANQVFAGPTTGSDAAPTFRALVAADIPTLTASKISDFAEAAMDVIAAMLVAGTNVTLSYNDAGDQLTISSSGGGGGGTTISRETGTVVYDSGALASAGALDTGTISLTGYDYVTIEMIDARAQASVANAGVLLAFNNDTTAANYSSLAHNVGTGSVHSIATTTSDRNITVVPGASATANFVSHATITVRSPAGSNKKGASARTFETQSMSVFFDRLYDVIWNNVAAITRIALSVSNATTTFAAGSRMLVVGWKAEDILSP